MTDDYTPDRDRRARMGLDEAVFCGSKTAAQIDTILTDAREHDTCLLLTRLESAKYEALGKAWHASLDYDPLSRTAILGTLPALPGIAPRVAAVTAGTSDVAVAREAVRTLRHAGHACTEIHDVGVAGLWRLMQRTEELRSYPVLIVAAGMDAALPSVVGGLVSGAIIAVPTSAGYGVAEGGTTALHSMLASCAPGISVVNIDNGYGAACAAIRILNLQEPRSARA